MIIQLLVWGYNTIMNNLIDMNLIDEAIKNKKIHIFKNPFPDLPGWDDFLPVLSKYIAKDIEQYPDKSYLSTQNLNEPYLSFELRCRFWSRLTFQMFDPQDVLENDIKQLQPVIDWAKHNYGSRFSNSFALISLMANRGHVGLKHSDTVDQFQWQCQGKSVWRTGENLENEAIIEPGDFIFIPKGIDHEIETLVAPRAVINLVLLNE